jgi:hypothetical protein
MIAYKKIQHTVTSKKIDSPTALPKKEKPVITSMRTMKLKQDGYTAFNNGFSHKKS